MTTTTAPSVRPFTLDVPQDELDDLLDRVRRTRMPHVRGDGSDEVGVRTATMRELVNYWTDEFDWRAHERAINAMRHVAADVDGRRVHAVHERASGDGEGDGVTIVLLHGWPDSFLRYRHVVPRLVAAGHDVVVPSLPGFGFSEPGPVATPEAYAEAVRGLLDVLGLERYVVHGGDWGSATAEALALADPDRVQALHLSDVPFWHLFEVDAEQASEAEKRFLERGSSFADKAAYVSVQSTQATTIAHAFADSPVGQAAWTWEKYAAWTDREPDLDEVLAQVCLTWFTGTEHSSLLVYAGMGSWEEDADGTDEWSGGDPADWESPRPQAPTAFAIFPADIGVPPREYAERFFDVARFTMMPRGGHFAALEEPELLAEDLLGFVGTLPR